MNSLHRIFPMILAGALLLPGCHGGQANEAAPPLAGASIGGPFTLTDQDGRVVSDSDFQGKYRIFYFGYTYCPDACPRALQNIGMAMKALDKRDPALSAKIVPIFITVDPERDTVPVMKQYVANFYPRMVGLTGSVAQIDKVAKEFAIFHQKVQARDMTDYQVNHMDVAYLFGPSGQPIALLSQDGPPEKIEAELKRWVK